MKQVWKCDHCSKTSVYSDKIKDHELGCAFNPINKTCYSCEHHYDYYGTPSCVIGKDVCEGEDNGNCIGWLTDDKNELRKLKLEKICKNLAKS